MTDKHGAGSPEGARKATGGEPASATGERGRFSSRRKLEAVLRVLRGESLDAVSREIGVTASSFASWRDDFLVGGQANLKSRPADARDDELARLRGKVDELTMDNELLLARCHRLEGHLPLAVKRSRR
jgi:transposase-like protein